jgi:hypothetical protein
MPAIAIPLPCPVFLDWSKPKILRMRPIRAGKNAIQPPIQGINDRMNAMIPKTIPAIAI